MLLSKAQAVLRPRNTWEAMDLGILLARRHAGLLMASWAVITLPLFALLSLVLWQYPTAVVLIIWWLKPAFERLPLHILSRALFADTPTLRESLKAFPQLLKPQLLASLTWRRISMTRSFNLPIQQLEGLNGSARKQRVLTLGKQYTRAPTWLTVIGLHIEMALWIGMVALLYQLIPAQLQLNWDWQKLLESSQDDWLWAEHLSNALYMLALIIWEPIYVACGFTLYLNRRTELESWDVELVFRNLAQRLQGSAVLLLVLGFCLLPMSKTVWAQPVTAYPSELNADELGPTDPRLLKQMLNSEQAQQGIQQLLEKPPFNNYKDITSWRFGEPSEEKPKTSSGFKAPAWLKNALKNISFIVQILLWSSVILLSVYVLWRYREWLRTFSQKWLPNKQRRVAPVQTLFGLQVSNDSLADNWLAQAESLWDSDPRGALSLLYRGLLNHLLNEHALPLTDAHTEGEVLVMARGLDMPLQHYSAQLTVYWQNLAWGHRLPEHAQFTALCQQWQQLHTLERTA